MRVALAGRAGLAAIVLVLTTGCTPPSENDATSAAPTPTTSSEGSPAAADPLPAASTKLGDFPALWLDYEWSQDKDKFVRQRQCHVWVEGQVYTMTVTAPASAIDKVAPHFEKVIGTFKPKRWSAT